MSLLRRMFGPSQEEVWRQLCAMIGADYVEGGFLHSDRVEARVEEWIVTLDTCTASDGHIRGTCTRIRAPYVNQDGFRFGIHRRNLSHDLGIPVGMHEIEVGDPKFHRDFLVQTNDESKGRALFAHTHIREALLSQPDILLMIKDDEGWFEEQFPEGVDELYLEVPGAIKDCDRLKGLYELFAETLHYLCHLGSAYESDPNLQH